MAAPQNLRAVGDRIEQLLDELRAAADPRSHDRAEELLRLVTELYGGGLARVVELRRRGRARRSLDALVDDELVASLLSCTACTPTTSRRRSSRRSRACGRSSPSTTATSSCSTSTPTPGAVHLRLLGSCDGCPSSAVTLQHAVERAILEAAPEIVIDRRRAAGATLAVGPPAVPGRRSAASRPYDELPDRGAGVTTADPLAVLQRHPRDAARAASLGRASAASCAPSRSPTSTATSSTSRHAACCAPAGAATCSSRPRARAAATTGPCPTATSRSPTSGCRRRSGTRCRSR